MNKFTHSYCDVCECEISNIGPGSKSQAGYTVCGSAECQQVLRQGLLMPGKMCDLHLEFNKKLIRDRCARQSQKKEFMRDIQEKETREMLDIQQKFFVKFTNFDNDSTLFLTIPCSSPDVVTNSLSRKREYLAHLKKVIRNAIVHNEIDKIEDDEQNKAYMNSIKLDQLFSAYPGLLAVSDHLCAMCKGGCCASGNNHAYLSSQTVRKYLDKYPDTTPVDLFKLYISHINTESIEGACINQGVTGCSLPRELRSDICNAFYCDSLEKFHRRCEDGMPVETVVAVQRSSTYWSRFDPDVKNRIIDIAVVSECGPESVFSALQE